MNSLWNDDEARPFLQDPLSLRVYTSRLLGRDPDLVMHGGGNTSVKTQVEDLFGELIDVIYVKGSGWDLATIEAEGYAPVRLDVLQRLATLESLTDSDMVKAQRSAMLDPNAPGPSVEAILHAIIPFRFVDHSHSDAVVTITNTLEGGEHIRQLYGDRVLVVPYVMPGFILARTVWEMTRDVDWQKLEGMILLQHGVFTFHDDGRQSYERMIQLVDEAEQFLQQHKALAAVTSANQPAPPLDRLALARIRRQVGERRGAPVLCQLEDSAAARGFANLDNAADLATRGPLTPDHVLRTKRIPICFGSDTAGNFNSDLDAYAEQYRAYFEAFDDDGSLTCLDSAPRWGVWPGHGTLSLGRSAKEVGIIHDIVRHTVRAIQWADRLGGWRALPPKAIFDVEYWELEQAKLKKTGGSPPLLGRVALVTGAAQGIGRACAEALQAAGAVVVGIDLDATVAELTSAAGLGLVCDVTDGTALDAALQRTVQTFGGLDIVVANAGFFPGSRMLVEEDPAWQKSLDVNLTAHRNLLRLCTPLLTEGFDPSVVMIASKNVPAPGPGAAAYSVAKAGMTQLARVAALELGPKGIRVNVLHPHGVFDTALWSGEVLATRARHYGMSIERYKANNLLGIEIASRDVAASVCALVSDAFRGTTGAQIPIDGGNDRVI